MPAFPDYSINRIEELLPQISFLPHATNISGQASVAVRHMQLRAATDVATAWSITYRARAKIISTLLLN